MKRRQDKPIPRNKPPHKASRLAEARRIIEEYAAALREIINKLRRRMN
jgi:hypothetical protein